MLRILHPTDLSRPSSVAFAHAMKLTLASRGELTIFHMAREAEAEDDIRSLPHIRETLVRWELLPPDAPRGAVGSLGVHILKIEALGNDPTDAVLTYLKRQPADLVVLATHQHRGVARWLHREVAAPLFGDSSLPALFVPPGTNGFVDPDTGQTQLQRIILPIDQDPHPDSTLKALPGIVRPLHAGPVTVELLHVGTSENVPKLHLPEVDGWTWTTRVTDGHVVEEILRAADTESADLLALTTNGRNGFLDALRGTTTEQIVRSAHCPVLAVPTKGSDIGVLVKP